MPRTDEVLDQLGKAQWYSKLDLKAGYWQIVVDPADRHKTAFVTRDGLFEFLVMPFGLTSAPATLQRLMDTVLSELPWHKVMVYLDDIIVYSETWQEHLATIDEVLRRPRAAGLKASPSKCAFAQTSKQYLGHVVTREGVLPDPDNIKAVLEYPTPTSLTHVRSFMGMVQYYSKYIHKLAEIAKPLYYLSKRGVHFTWRASCQAALDILKQKLTTAAVLRRPDTRLPCIMQTDLSPVAIGAIVAQEAITGQEHPIAYASKMLHDAGLKYSATEGECLAAVHFIEHFQPYLRGVPFPLEVDHWALRWLMTSRLHNNKLERWALKLEEYDFVIKHRQGSQNGDADALSRLPVPVPVAAVAMLNVVDEQPLQFADSDDDCEQRIGGGWRAFFSGGE